MTAGIRCRDYVLSAPKALTLQRGVPHMVGVAADTPLWKLSADLAG